MHGVLSFSCQEVANFSVKFALNFIRSCAPVFCFCAEFDGLGFRRDVEIQFGLGIPSLDIRELCVDDFSVFFCELNVHADFFDRERILWFGYFRGRHKIIEFLFAVKKPLDEVPDVQQHRSQIASFVGHEGFTLIVELG